MWRLNGLIWSQLVADALNAVAAIIVFKKVHKDVKNQGILQEVTGSGR